MIQRVDYGKKYYRRYCPKKSEQDIEGTIIYVVNG